MNTLSKQIENFLRNPHEWVHKGRLLRMEWRSPNNTLYMSETVGRTLRTLESSSVIAVKDDDNGKSVMYKWLPHQRRASYIPWSERPLGKKHVIFVGVIQSQLKP